MDVVNNLRILSCTCNILTFFTIYHMFSRYSLITRFLSIAYFVYATGWYIFMCSYGNMEMSAFDIVVIFLWRTFSSVWAMCYSFKYCCCLDRLKYNLREINLKTSFFRELVLIVLRIMIITQIIVLISYSQGTFRTKAALWPVLSVVLMLSFIERFLTLFCLAFASIRERILRLCEDVEDLQASGGGGGGADKEALTDIQLKDLVDTFVQIIKVSDVYGQIFSILIPWSHFYIILSIDLMSYGSSLVYLGVLQHTIHAYWRIPPALARLHNIARGERLKSDSKAFLNLVLAFPPKLRFGMGPVTTILGSISMLANCVVTLLQFVGVF